MARIDRHLSAALLGATVCLMPAAAAAQEVQWRHDYATARREAQQTNRPMVLDFGTKSCFWCKKLDTSTFRDARVVKELNERFVPIKIDAEEQEKLATALGIDSFPTLVFAAPDGKILGTHSGFVDAARFGKQLQRALKESVAAAPATPVVRAASDDPEPAPQAPVADGPTAPLAGQLLQQGQEAFRAGDFVTCLERCRLLTSLFANGAEAAEAAKLEERVKSEPELMRRTCVQMEDRLGETYLSLADECVRKHQPQQAALYWQRVMSVCAGSHAAEVARDRLAAVARQVHTARAAHGPSSEK